MEKYSYTIKDLNRIRGRIKTKLTNTEKFIGSYVMDGDDETQKIILQQKLDLINEMKDEISMLFQQYLQVTNEDKTTCVETDTVINDLDEQRNKHEVSLKCLLSKIKLKNNQIEMNTSTNKNIDLTSKLPDIPLPIFGGKIEEFSNFKAQFTTLIKNNEHLTNEQKLFYLKAALRGEAKLIETSDDSFESLFLVLQERYENKRAVVDIYIQAILNLEKLNFETSKGLRNITDTVKRSLRALKVLNLECDELTNAIIVSVILKKNR